MGRGPSRRLGEGYFSGARLGPGITPPPSCGRFPSPPLRGREELGVTYTELQVTSHFSFLRGVSSAEELFAAAAVLGHKALGIVDRNSVGGLVHALRAAETTGVRLIAGCRLDLMDGNSLLVWPEDRASWSRLTRLLTLGKSRADRKKGEKGQCFLHWEDVDAYSQ